MTFDLQHTGTDVSQARLRVDLDALAANYRLLRDMSAGAETAPVVKADGYGLSAAQVAKRLWAEGARSFFVARLAEGESLRGQLGPERRAVIYVLDGCSPGAAPRLHKAQLTPVLNSFGQISEWAAFAGAAGARLSAALHIDTGLNRLGLSLDESRALSHASDRLRAFDLELVISHLACGSEPDSPMNAVQADRFARAAALFPGVRRSLASSGGVFLGPSYHLDMVRPGISLYGGGPFGRPDGRLAPVASFMAPILQIRSAAPGETIGYGATFRVDRPMRVAVVAGGYADGVLRAASPRGYGWLEGARCDFLGRISMDLIALDVTDREAAQPDALQPGAFVELIGPNVNVDLAAEAAGTISLELLSRIGARTPRVYIGEVD